MANSNLSGSVSMAVNAFEESVFLKRAKSAETLARIFRNSSTGTGYDALVTGQSRALAELSHEIVEAIHRASQRTVIEK